MSEHPTARDRHGDFAPKSAPNDRGGDVGENLFSERAVDRGRAASAETGSPGEVVLHEVRFLPNLNLSGTRRKREGTVF